MPPKLIVEVVGDTSNLEKAFARSSRASRQFGRNMESAGRGAAAATLSFRGLGRSLAFASGAFLGGAGFIAAAKAGFDEMAEGQKVAAQTAAALKSTGKIAGVTADQIGTLAGSLQKLTGFDDEAIQSAENLLLTFTNVRNVAGQNNDIFNRATLAALDLSRTFDQDLSSSAVQLGKALQDPIRGVTALRRIGVSFTADQQKLIKRLVETGNVLAAQKIVLREVARETGGAAKAYGKTLPGQIDILKGNLSNLAGDLAKTLNPQVERLTRNFNKWLEDPENKEKIINDFASAMQALGAAAKFTADAIRTVKNAWDSLPDFGKHKGLIDLIPGAHFSGLDLLRKLGVIGGGGSKAAGPNFFSNPITSVFARSFPSNLFNTGPAAAAFATPPGSVGIPGRVSGTAATPGLRIPSRVSGTVATPGLLHLPRLRGAFQFLQDSFTAPLRLQLEQARAAATGASLTPILLKMKAAAERALRSGKLAVQGQIDAWNAIADINERLGKDVAAQFRHISASKLASALSGLDRRHQIALLSTIGPGGSLPNQQPAFARAGATYAIGELHLHGVENPRLMEDQLEKLARRRPQIRRGAR